MDMDTQQLPASAMSANLEIRRVGVFLGARITGIDLTKALDEATVFQVHRQEAGIDTGLLLAENQRKFAAKWNLDPDRCGGAEARQGRATQGEGEGRRLGSSRIGRVTAGLVPG